MTEQEASEFYINVFRKFERDFTENQRFCTYLIQQAYAAGKNAGLKQAEEIAGSHECGGYDDIICQHQNCAAIISAECRAQAEQVKR